MKYIDITDGSKENVELPLEDDDTMLLTTLSGQFPAACGLKYQPEGGKGMRGLRLEEGRIHPPEEGWGNNVYVVNLKENAKRKIGDIGGGASKLKRVERKSVDLIVLGLAYSASDEDLRSYFSQYGELELAEVKKESGGRSKGFGFIRFTDPSSQRLILGQRHDICGRSCEVRLPMSKTMGGSGNPAKLFIGRVPPEMSAEDLREYFEQFGEVTDAYKPSPSRGFAFITFLDPDVAESLCGEDTVVKGKSLFVGMANPKNPAASGRGRGFPPAMGMGMGGYGEEPYGGYAGGFKKGGRGGGFSQGGGYYPLQGGPGSGGLSSGMSHMNLSQNQDLYAAAHAALMAAIGNQDGPPSSDYRDGKPGGGYGKPLAAGRGKIANGVGGSAYGGHGSTYGGQGSTYGSQASYSQAFGSYGSNPYYQGP